MGASSAHKPTSLQDLLQSWVGRAAPIRETGNAYVYTHEGMGCCGHGDEHSCLTRGVAFLDSLATNSSSAILILAGAYWNPDRRSPLEGLILDKRIILKWISRKYPCGWVYGAVADSPKERSFLTSWATVSYSKTSCRTRGLPSHTVTLAALLFHMRKTLTRDHNFISAILVIFLTFSRQILQYHPT